MRHLSRAFVSQWVKLRRPTVLAGTVLTSMFFAAVTTVLVLGHTTNTRAAEGNHGEMLRAALEVPSGIVHGLTLVVGFLGVVAIVVCAFMLASEYTQGALRNLVVRQPRRLTLLAGSYLALISLVLIAAVLAGVTAVIAGYVAAPADHISTSLWSAEQAVKGTAEVALAMVGYATFGAALAVLLRSPVAAIGVAVGWFLAVESILAAVVSGADKWLPGQQLQAIAQNGTATVSFAHALVLSAAYLAVFVAAAAVSFRRRDIAA